MPRGKRASAEGKSFLLAHFSGKRESVNGASEAAGASLATWLELHATTIDGKDAVFQQNLRRVADQVRRLTIHSEWGCGLLIDHRWPSSDRGSGAAEMLLRVLRVEEGLSPLTAMKGEAQWDIADFSLGSADPVSANVILHSLAEGQFSCAWRGSCDFRGRSAALRAFTEVVSDVSRRFASKEIRDAMVPSSGSLGGQFTRALGVVVNLMAQGDGRADAASIVSALLEAKEEASGGSEAKAPSQKAPGCKPLCENCHGWRMWVAVVEHVTSAVFTPQEFADVMALWLIDLLTPPSVRAASAPAFTSGRPVLHYLLNYLDRRLVEAVRGDDKTPLLQSRTEPLLVGATQRLVARAGPQQSVLPPRRRGEGGVPQLDQGQCGRLHEMCFTKSDTVTSTDVEALSQQAAGLLLCCQGSQDGDADALVAVHVDANATIETPPVIQGLIFDDICLWMLIEHIFLHYLETGRTVAADHPASAVDYLARLVESYKQEGKRFLKNCDEKGCAWASKKGVDQCVAVLDCVVALEASRTMRREYKSLTAHTLVPHKALCEELLENTLALSTTMKQCVITLRAVLSAEEYGKKNVLIDLDGALGLLYHDPALHEHMRSGADKWVREAERRAESTFYHIKGSEDSLKRAEEERERLLKKYHNNSDFDTYSDMQARKRAHKEVYDLEDRKFDFIFIPFSNERHIAACFMPDLLVKLMGISFDLFVSLSQVAVEDGCPSHPLCVFHNVNIQKSWRPSGKKTLNIPHWIFLESSSSFAVTQPLSRCRYISTIDSVISKPSPHAAVTVRCINSQLRLAPDKFFIRAASVRPPQPMSTSGMYSTAAMVTSAAEHYGWFYNPHPTADLKASGTSSRENSAYSIPPLNGALSKEQWIEVYSIRSHKQTQVSRLLAALRGRCVTLVDLFETDFILQHYLVTVLSDVAALVQHDAQAAMAQLPLVETDIPACVACKAPLLLFYSALYGLCDNAEVRHRVLLACVEQLADLARECWERCATVGGALVSSMVNAYTELYRLATVGLVCFGFVPLVDCQDSLLAARFFAAGSQLALHRGLSRSMCGADCTSLCDPLTDAGLYALGRIQETLGPNGCHEVLTAHLVAAYPVAFAGVDIAWGEYTGTLRFGGRMSRVFQRCDVDLHSGTVLVDDRTLGGLPGSIMRTPLYAQLIGEGVPIAVWPLSRTSWYRSRNTFPWGRRPGQDTEGCRVSLLFSATGDIALHHEGDGYALTSLWCTVPVHADVGGIRYFHLAGRFTADHGDSADVVLFKPIPGGVTDAAGVSSVTQGASATPWMQRLRDRAQVHYIAVRKLHSHADDTISSPSGTTTGVFKLYAVPVSLREAPFSADLLANLDKWDRVVMDANVIAGIAQLFAVDSIIPSRLLVTLPPRRASTRDGDTVMPVSVTLPSMDLRFALTDHSLQARGGYVLCRKTYQVSWLRGTGGGGDGHRVMVAVKDTSEKTRTKAAFQDPDEKVLWVAERPASTGTGFSVTEVWRHHHFRYLETRSTAERLRLCALLLGAYPIDYTLSSDPLDGELTLLEEVCGLLRRCVSNSKFNKSEQDAYNELWAVANTQESSHGRWILRTWLRRLLHVRGELQPLAEGRRAGQGCGDVPSLQDLGLSGEAARDDYAEHYVRSLMMRRLLPHRCAMPPELATLTGVEHLYPTSEFLVSTAKMRRHAAAEGDVEGGVRAFLYAVEEADAALSDVRLQRVAWMLIRTPLKVHCRVSAGLESVSSHRARIAALLSALPELLGGVAVDGKRGPARKPPRRTDAAAQVVRAVRRACRAHPQATLTLQEVGHLCVRGVHRWVEEVLPGADGGRTEWWPETVVAAVEKACRVYVEACVFQDWLRRLLIALQRCDMAEFSSAARHNVDVELSSPRNKVRAHRSWLVFEAEQRLAIRRVQYETWQMMWESVTTNPGDTSAKKRRAQGKGLITQLNMGEGKTRVIVPMLLLTELEEGGGRGAAGIPCVHALSALAGELRGYLHEALNSPGLRVRVLAKPFCRDVVMTAGTASAMMSSFRRFCNRAVLVEQREHFVSFLQKHEEELLLVDPRHPASAPGSTCDRGNRVLPPTMDTLLGPRSLHIFDEADELLSCHYNLVYSAGKVMRLADGEMRCNVAAHLLVCCTQVAVSFPELFEFTDPTYMASVSPGTLQTRYPPCYIKHSSDTTQFFAEVLSVFLSSPPQECRWMMKRADDIRHLIEAKVPITEEYLSGYDGYLPAMVEQVMCLRGYFQHGLLHFGLGQRLNVNFGVPPSSRTTRMAVPYVAADVPSERSEFAQPDVAIMLTYIAYMQHGLSLEQFKEGLAALLLLWDVQREREFQKWIAADPHYINACLAVDDKDGAPLASVQLPAHAARIDPNNEAMIEKMHGVLRRNMAVVGFWVFNCVLQREGRYHSHLLRATAWDIASQQRMVGFSGTKDGCRLLPRSVAFQEHTSDQIRGTTERMSRLIVEHTTGTVATLGWNRKRNHANTKTGKRNANATYTQAEQYIRDAILTHGCDVLIDAGALLVGTSPRAMAELIASLLEHGTLLDASSCRGICFFDHERAHPSWVLMDTATRHTAPLEEASLTPADCFVVYDQARCRGSDLKLRHNAKALLSLARGLQRDDLLQAVGRLRQFGKGQSVAFIAPVGVAAEITKGTAARVLSWAVRNTDKALSHAIPEYVGAATHHMLKVADRRGGKVCAVPTPTPCSYLYKNPVQHLPCTQFLALTMGGFTGSPTARGVITALTAFAGGMMVSTALSMSTGATTEREVEVEVEVEQEVEHAFHDPHPEPCVDLHVEMGLKEGVSAAWCGDVSGLPMLGTLVGHQGSLPMHFTSYFHTVFKDVDGSRKGAVQWVREGGVPLRYVRYLLFSPSDGAVRFITLYQAAVLLERYLAAVPSRAGYVDGAVAYHVSHHFAPYAVIVASSPAESEEVGRDPRGYFGATVVPHAVALARLYNGECNFTIEAEEALRDILAMPIAGILRDVRTMRQAARMQPDEGRGEEAEAEEDDAADGGDGKGMDDRLLMFPRCRGTIAEVPDSALKRLCDELVHTITFDVAAEG